MESQSRNQSERVRCYITSRSAETWLYLAVGLLLGDLLL